MQSYIWAIVAVIPITLGAAVNYTKLHRWISDRKSRKVREWEKFVKNQAQVLEVKQRAIPENQGEMIIRRRVNQGGSDG
jgi:hypothetical protein